MSKEAEAADLVKRAQSISEKLIYLGGNKWETAQDMFIKAANLFKLSKNWDSAADAHLRAAQCRLKLKSRYEAAQSYVDAANCYRHSNPIEAVRCLQMASEIYIDNGKFQTAAKHEKEMAEICEEDGQDLDQAIAHYKQAADYFMGENATSSANQCKLKAAQLLSEKGKYAEAIEFLEAVSTNSVDNNLLKFSVKEYLFKAMLCWLASVSSSSTADSATSISIDECKTALDRYQELDINFPGSRECNLIHKIIEAFENRDVDLFTDEVREFDSITKLDKWKTNIMLKIKNAMKGDNDDLR